MCFTRDLKFGQKYEEIAKTLIPEDEVVKDSPQGKFSGFDFNTNLYAYEVKADRLAYNYGCKSMFIEFECNKKDSGINVTTADYWFYFMVKPDESYTCYEVPVNVLKEECAKSRVVCGGDGGRVRGYIVITEKLQQYKIIQTHETCSCLVAMDCVALA